MDQAIVTTNGMNAIESVLVGGDLSKLTPDQRVQYYRAVCQSLDLNPLTRPFDYITLSGKLTLYARKDCAEQLRNKRNISIDKPEIQFEDDWIIVTVLARNSEGRSDSDVGAVRKTDMQGNFGNALMKAVTKAKRRVTLSICGLGILDETEIETIPDAKPVVVTDTGEIVGSGNSPAPVVVKANGNGHTDQAWNPVKALVDAGVCENNAAAATLLNKHVPAEFKTPEKLVAWGKIYRGWRDTGAEIDASVDHATKGEMPQ